MARKPPRRTRERILETGLELFNRHGEPHVTTADIADEMNISPGNLYYHFRNKDEIVGELYAAFDASVAPLLATPASRPSGVEDLWLLLHLLFERMWQYRFVYRDVDDITSRNARIAARFAAMTRSVRAVVAAMCTGMRETGALRASDREIDALATNVVVIATYWMSFQRVSQPAGRSVRGADEQAAGMRFERAAYQVLALLAPFLRDEERALVERLSADYL
ncbi:MAG TPA: TetR/AcrR family transcriptional regulator [Casimicrobiaceae bacterium]|nr:TetR/AcrR family transcriptional regulator [Casimicrobiaceae bacterium]